MEKASESLPVLRTSSPAGTPGPIACPNAAELLSRLQSFSHGYCARLPDSRAAVMGSFRWQVAVPPLPHTTPLQSPPPGSVGLRSRYLMPPIPQASYVLI